MLSMPLYFRTAQLFSGNPHHKEEQNDRCCNCTHKKKTENIAAVRTKITERANAQMTCNQMHNHENSIICLP